jgi:hypothetical protein
VSKLIPPPWVVKRYSRRADFGRDLQGIGAAHTIHLRGFRGSRTGAASRGRSLSPDEIAAVEAQLRTEGKL